MLFWLQILSPNRSLKCCDFPHILSVAKRQTLASPRPTVRLGKYVQHIPALIPIWRTYFSRKCQSILFYRASNNWNPSLEDVYKGNIEQKITKSQLFRWHTIISYMYGNMVKTIGSPSENPRLPRKPTHILLGPLGPTHILLGPLGAESDRAIFKTYS